MTDIDKFKTVNDTYGHSVGDEVIQQMARILKLGLRPTDLLCRYGGEEFCIVLPGLDLAQAAVIAERLREKTQSQVGPAYAASRTSRSPRATAYPRSRWAPRRSRN